MNQFEIKVWAQMFFDDGSVSQGIRIPADIFDNPNDVVDLARSFVMDLNRTEGFLLIWGAGEVQGKYFVFTSLEESDSLVSSP